LNKHTAKLSTTQDAQLEVLLKRKAQNAVFDAAR
jgi:hypothetical protein